MKAPAAVCCSVARRMRCTCFEQFGALRQDAADNKALLAKGGKITMPVLHRAENFSVRTWPIICSSPPATSRRHRAHSGH